MQHGAAKAEDFSLAVDRDGDLPVLIALLGRGEEVLAAVLLPFHRTAELHRRGRYHRLLRIERRLGAEAAADERRDHPDRFQVALEQIGQRAAAEVRRLRRGPDRQHVGGRIVARQHGAAFQGHRRAAMQMHVLLEHVRRVLERGIDVAVAHRHEGGDVRREIGVYRRGAGLHRVAGVAHRRQRLVVDRDRGRRVLGEMAAVRHHHGDGLADVADLVAGERDLRARRLDRRIGHQHRDLAGGDARRHVVGGEHRVDAGHGASRRAVDAADAGVAMGAADEGRVQRAGQAHVVDELTSPGEERGVFEARDPCAKVLRAHPACPAK